MLASAKAKSFLLVRGRSKRLSLDMRDELYHKIVNLIVCQVDKYLKIGFSEVIMDKGGESIKPGREVSRRSMLRRTFGAITAVLTGAALAGQEVVQAPAAPKPQASKPTATGEQTASNISAPPAPKVEARSEANDHINWGININDDHKPPVKPSAVDNIPQVNSKASPDLPSEFEEQVVGMTYDQVRALPNDDPMKEELLKQLAQKIAKKP